MTTNEEPRSTLEATPDAVLAAVSNIMGTIVESGFDLADLLQNAIRNAVQLSRADFGNVIQIDESGDFYRVIAYHGQVSQAYWDLASDTRYRPSRETMVGRVLMDRTAVHIQDVLADPDYKAWDLQRAGGYRTILGVPMFAGDDVKGLLVVWRHRVEPFTDREISMLTTFADQAALAIQNVRLFQTVESQRKELARYAPQAAALLSSESGEQMLAGHRREITAMFCDLRGFTAFAESAEPEEVLGVLREYHAAVGSVVVAAGGTVEHFAGDGLMAFFNDPTLIEDHGPVAVDAAVQIRSRFERLAAGWHKRGYELGLGIGMALGFATLGRVGFEGRFEYGAVGNAVILASRLSDVAAPGEILVSQRLNAAVEDAFQTEQAEELVLKGFSKPVQAYRVLGANR